MHQTAFWELVVADCEMHGSSVVQHQEIADLPFMPILSLSMIRSARLRATPASVPPAAGKRGRITCGFAGRACEQVRVGHKHPDRQAAGPHRAADAACHRPTAANVLPIISVAQRAKPPDNLGLAFCVRDEGRRVQPVALEFGIGW
jgi:hypothetical protein